MSALEIFNYSGQQVRTVLVDGEPWFVAADVADALGYSSTAAMTRSMDADEKGVQNLHTLGGQQQFVVISEPGLYDAILRSRIEGAQLFKRWVKHEVLPAIRRTGQFGSQLPSTFAEALELAAAQARAIEAAEAKIAIDAPKVDAFHKLMDADGYYDMAAAAKLLGLGRTTLFKRLRNEGVLMPTSNQPYQRYMHHFALTTSTYTTPDGSTHVAYTTRVRPTGLAFIAKKLAVVVGDELAVQS